MFNGAVKAHYTNSDDIASHPVNPFKLDIDFLCINEYNPLAKTLISLKKSILIKCTLKLSAPKFDEFYIQKQ